jgi:hypothetical protein
MVEMYWCRTVLFPITIDEKLKFKIHINNQTKKANQRLGMIKRSFTYRYMDKNMFTTLYKSIVRPHLEYGSNITIPSVYYSLRETVFSNISSTLLLVDFMLVASGGVLIFRKDFIAIYLIYIVNNSKIYDLYTR